MLTVVSGVLLDGSVWGKTCPAGQVHMTNQCHKCPSGCWCEGGSVRLDPDDVIDWKNVKEWCKQRDSKRQSNCELNGTKPSGYQECGKNKEAGLHRCPDEFPLSSEQSPKPEACHFYKDGEYFWYKARGCDAGKYLKAKTQDEPCEPCPDGYKCPGFKFDYVSMTQDKGLYKCPDGYVSNETKTDCIQKSTATDNNTGLPDTGEAITNSPGDKKGIVCDPGYYLPAGGTTPRPCSGTKKYCPGGVFSKKSTEQGRFDCPNNSLPVPADRASACEMHISKDQMKFGPLGKQSNVQCWTMTDKADFKACVLGVR